MTAPNPAADVRALIEDVRARHYPWLPQQDDLITECGLCAQPWLCDAAKLADKLEQAVTALEDIANYHFDWSNEHRINEVTNKMQATAVAALAALEEGE